MTKPAFIYSTDMLNYKFSDGHPFNQLRVKLTYDLLSASGLLSNEQIIAPRIATDQEIALIHDVSYIEAVKKAGAGTLNEAVAANHGLGTEDTPIFPRMHEASALITGATLTACDLVMEGKATYAFNPSGGLHHGFRGKASGFCIYNDSAVAIEYLKRNYGVKVLYVDTDAHHGDGVQWAFYEDERVCTLSLHETGRYLFPGTGSVMEKGQGDGYGYSFNIPVDAFTEDESWLQLYTTSLQEVMDYFQPDVIMTQNGADAHYFDPLTHLSVTMDTYKAVPKLAKALADRYCQGRWIATGGGGYDIWRVVPRAWSYIWAVMNEQAPTGNLPIEWLQTWQKEAPVQLVTTWEDAPGMYKPIPRKQEITDKNNLTLEKALFHIRPYHKKT
ncbi:Histone deacetylase [Fictibacillus macauensis ZFHKF-1]|uniref:Acetoin utilization protein AcuC n=1 Tax=Fictibacillus macauensis ZFHKF-1 TaxID=1196324 RepID=I8UFA8_9BACL|nr:acetoin utilization protein AcuC [Fictibacillus macauensis]EIT85483.1 Histone deacetylase [Fictibacillus macauensis ZFHKF-1]